MLQKGNGSVWRLPIYPRDVNRGPRMVVSGPAEFDLSGQETSGVRPHGSARKGTVLKLTPRKAPRVREELSNGGLRRAGDDEGFVTPAL